jgi:hypothetical protein
VSAAFADWNNMIQCCCIWQDNPIPSNGFILAVIALASVACNDCFQVHSYVILASIASAPLAMIGVMRVSLLLPVA